MLAHRYAFPDGHHDLHTEEPRRLDLEADFDTGLQGASEEGKVGRVVAARESALLAPEAKGKAGRNEWLK